MAVASWVAQYCARHDAFAEWQLMKDEEALSNDHDARYVGSWRCVGGGAGDTGGDGVHDAIWGPAGDECA